VASCSRQAYRTVRFCGQHYTLPGQIRRARQQSGTCAEPSCDKPIFRQGLCSMHHTRLRRAEPQVEHCALCGLECHRVAFCSAHFHRVKSHGDPEAGGAMQAERGTPWVGSGGYVYQRVDGEVRAQHQVVMEQHLGRPLWPDENVHHKNGDRADNRLSNLELWSTRQPSGQRPVDKVAYAREILLRYSPEDLTAKARRKAERSLGKNGPPDLRLA
jgi:hypothetical protein